MDVINELITIAVIEILGILLSNSAEWLHNIYGALLYGAAAAVVAIITISIIGDIVKDKDKKKEKEKEKP